MLTDDVKVVLLGASTVGKTSAVRAFAGQGFVEHYVPTRDFETTTINLPGAVGEASMECVFWDCNPETFVQNPEHILGGATCVVLAYDVTNYDSYLEVCSSWMELVKLSITEVTKRTKVAIANFRSMGLVSELSSRAVFACVGGSLIYLIIVFSLWTFNVMCNG